MSRNSILPYFRSNEAIGSEKTFELYLQLLSWRLFQSKYKFTQKYYFRKKDCIF